MEKKNYEKLMDYLNSQEVFKKNIRSHHYQVGSSVFAPISVYEDNMTVKLNEGRNVFNKLIERVKEKFDFIRSAMYVKNDGTCPPELYFVFDTQIKKVK